MKLLCACVCLSIYNTCIHINHFPECWYQHSQDDGLDFHDAVSHEISAAKKLRGQMWLPMFDPKDPQSARHFFSAIPRMHWDIIKGAVHTHTYLIFQFFQFF